MTLHLCNYVNITLNSNCIISHQYLIQRWARVFRDNTFHESINMNNGTEALNKALKYSYMPRNKHSMNLSSIVSLLVENFLPSFRQKYLFSNFEQSSLNRKYNECVPSYLQDRPREVILHCLDRKTSSARFTQTDITVVDNEEGIFEIKNSKGHSYTVKFATPSCTCGDWTEHQYPCKHFFSIFHHYPNWDWNALPQAYLCSPKLSLDTQALKQYFDEDPSITQFDCIMGNDNCMENMGDHVPKRKVHVN